MGECRDVCGGIGTKDYKVGIEALGDEAAVGRVAEALSGVGGERGEDLREGHACARHELEFFGGVVVIDVANVGAKEDLAARGGIDVKLVDRERDDLLDRLG